MLSMFKYYDYDRLLKVSYLLIPECQGLEVFGDLSIFLICMCRPPYCVKIDQSRSFLLPVAFG